MSKQLYQVKSCSACYFHTKIYYKYHVVKFQSQCFKVQLSITGLYQNQEMGSYGSSFAITRQWASLLAQRVMRLSAMWETRVRSLSWEDPLQKEMATHSSTLAWKIPWMEEPGGEQSTGLQRVGHNERLHSLHLQKQQGFPGGSVVKYLPASAGDQRDLDLIPGSGRSPGVGNDNLLQYSCRENPTDRGAQWATVHGVAKESEMTWQLKGETVEATVYLVKEKYKILSF